MSEVPLYIKSLPHGLVRPYHKELNALVSLRRVCSGIAARVFSSSRPTPTNPPATPTHNHTFKTLLYEKTFNLKLSGSEVYYTS